MPWVVVVKPRSPTEACAGKPSTVIQFFPLSKVAISLPPTTGIRTDDDDGAGHGARSVTTVARNGGGLD